MQIKQLDIYGYGKWVDQRFNLNEGLQIFLGQNEAGKSTLMSFIHSILFGFPTRNSTFLRYEPQESSKYGGRILAEDRILGEVIIERVHGKVTGDVTVTLEDGTTGSEELLEQLLKGLSRENYQSIYSFSLSDIENVHQLDKGKLSRYLLNIGAHSTDYYLNLVDEFQKNAYDLYRPSGRIPPLNKQLAEITGQEKKLDQLEQRNQSYIDLIRQQAEQNELLKQIEKKEKNIQKELTYLKEFKKDLTILREIQKLKQEIAQVQLPPLTNDGLYLLSEYKKEIEEVNDSLEKLEKESTKKKASFLNPKVIEDYQENKNEISMLEQELPELIEELGRVEAIELQIQENTQRLQEIKQLLNVDKQEQSPSPFTKNEQIMITDWLASHAQLASKIGLLTTELQKIENQLNMKNQKADQYEDLMWPADYFKEIESQLKLDEESKPTMQKSARPILTIGTVLIGIIALVVPFVIPVIDPWFGVGISIVFFVLSFFLYRQGRTKKITQEPESASADHLLMNEYKKQRAIQSDWQILLGEIDAIQGNYQTKMNERAMLGKEQKDLTEKWRMILISKSLPTVHLFENAEAVIAQTEDLKKIEEKNGELISKKAQITEHLDQKMRTVDNILDFAKELPLAEKLNQFRRYLKELNQLLQAEESKLDELTALNEQEKQLIARKETAKTKMNHLLESSGVQEETEFIALYKKKEEVQQKKSRMQFLKENAPEFDVEKALPSKEELLKKEEQLLKKLHEESEKSKEIINQRANVQVNINNLERDGSYSEALQEFENKKASTQSLVDEWISDKIAAAIIQSTLNKVTKERFEEIMSEINYYFKVLTNGEYENILFKADELFVQKKDGSVMEVKALSRGTAEPLYVAIRLAYIVKMEDVIRLPIVIDDPFVNFDQQRKENVYRLLDELSDKLQIIYFSFDTELKEKFSTNQMIELENIKND